MWFFTITGVVVWTALVLVGFLCALEWAEDRVAMWRYSRDEQEGGRDA